MVARRDFPTAPRCRQTFFSEAVEKPESTLTPHIISASAQTKPVIAINIRFMTLLCCSNRNTHAEEKTRMRDGLLRNTTCSGIIASAIATPHLSYSAVPFLVWLSQSVTSFSETEPENRCPVSHVPAPAIF